MHSSYIIKNTQENYNITGKANSGSTFSPTEVGNDVGFYMVVFFFLILYSKQLTLVKKVPCKKYHEICKMDTSFSEQKIPC